MVRGMTQESTLLISNSLLKTDSAEINISRMNGWIFKKGNQSNWANAQIDVTGWKKIKPEELTIQDADQNGKLEGWFRMKIRTDQSLNNKVLGFRYTGWGAAELYVDGKLVESFGTIGTDGTLVKEYNPLHRSSVAIPSGPEIEHIIAIHYVDVVADFPYPTQLRSNAFVKIRQYTFTNALFSLTGPDFNSANTDHFYAHLSFKAAVAGIILVITVLFWLVTYQNPREISLRLVAIFSTMGVLYSGVRIIWHSQMISFNTFSITQGIANFLSVVTMAFIPFVIAESLRQKITGYIKALFVVEVLFGIISFFFYSYLAILPTLLLSILNLLLCCYFILRARKTIKGAQWAIVASFFILVLCSILSLIFISKISVQSHLFLEALIFLSFPFGYVVYISMRFREIILEVKESAAQLVMISDEKKELIADQNEMLEQQVTERTSELHQSLQDLKATQKQLIQSEKMASLGELTAGIAHEIQNPLNFVNNFSEVSTELVDEMNEEISNGNIEDAKSIGQDLKQNLEKISHHGKRAGDIVKGMLQHSRSSNGVKEPTNINVLCDEYLRLAYHGLRAKDKDFNATLITDFDDSVDMINVIPQEIGRVILNLITNAFYAVAEKKKILGEKYAPTVTVTTKRTVPLPGGPQGIEVRVSDNGNGIPQKVLDKIFQPFFTTKPTGQGTGLGLSLSYDIVKAHGGELKVETKEGEGSIFSILLSMNN
jgi:signal transduction histidine kinase